MWLWSKQTWWMMSRKKGCRVFWLLLIVKSGRYIYIYINVYCIHLCLTVTMSLVCCVSVFSQFASCLSFCSLWQLTECVLSFPPNHRISDYKYWTCLIFTFSNFKSFSGVKSLITHHNTGKSGDPHYPPELVLSWFFQVVASDFLMLLTCVSLTSYF